VSFGAAVPGEGACDVDVWVFVAVAVVVAVVEAVLGVADPEAGFPLPPEDEQPASITAAIRKLPEVQAPWLAQRRTSVTMPGTG
jgi:hypothetical protein